MKMYKSRDPGIQRIQARHDKRCYGMGLGIMILDDVYPDFQAMCATPAPTHSRSSTKLWKV